MGFVDEAVVKAKEVFDVAAKKTGDVVETQKLKFKATQLKGSMARDFEELGREYFEQIKEGLQPTEKAQSIVANIEVKNDEYLEIQEQLDEYRNVSVCENCGAKNAKDALFCNKCGQQL
jgi:ribosomal protein L40E